ncbi:hypothetical protein AGMMS50239_12060 [Bacteroidia bacterium]|nr:hypothetical protein AGMMS50239_12060 [Bacteroidia bacterium]
MQSPGHELVQLPDPEFEPVARTDGFKFLLPLIPCPVKAFSIDKPVMATTIHIPNIFIFLVIVLYFNK